MGQAFSLTVCVEISEGELLLNKQFNYRIVQKSPLIFCKLKNWFVWNSQRVVSDPADRKSRSTFCTKRYLHSLHSPMLRMLEVRRYLLFFSFDGGHSLRVLPAEIISGRLDSAAKSADDDLNLPFVGDPFFSF